MQSDRQPGIDLPAASRRPAATWQYWRWGVALLALGLAGWVIQRGIRVAELRAMAVDASETRRAGHWQQLETITHRWLEKDPRAGVAYILAAEAAEKQDSPGRMASYLERMPEDDPRTAAALLEVATAYFGPLNQPSKGEAACLKSLQLADDNLEARRRLVFYYCMTLQRSKLIAFAREAIAKGNDTPETYVYLIGADWITLSDASQYNAKWLQSGDDPEHFLVGYLIHRAGSSDTDPASAESPASAVGLDADPQLARRVNSLLGGAPGQHWSNHHQRLAACLEIYPGNPELIAFQLRRATAEGDLPRVAQLLEAVPASAAGDNRFYHYKGWLHDARDEKRPAVQAYREALRHNPFDWRSQLRLAVTLRLLGETDEADRLAELAIVGKELRETIMQLADVQAIPMPVLTKMLDYCRGCGDALVADGLSRRIAMLRSSGEAS
jgi:tetratricopeptide (TPR) repeat protein